MKEQNFSFEKTYLDLISESGNDPIVMGIKEVKRLANKVDSNGPNLDSNVTQ